MNKLIMTTVALIATAAMQASAGNAGPLTGSMKSIDGKDVELGSYSGKVVLVVNVASRCGFTRQYKGLQELHRKYAARGLAVLGFPCNQFGGQEPEDEAGIRTFCSSKFGVDFDLFAKSDVNGPKASPLFKRLTSDEAAIQDKGPVKWNFEKFLIGRDGRLIERFRSRVEPDDAGLIKAIEAALGPDAKKP